MTDQQVIDYIKKTKAAAVSDEQIKSALLKNGWTEQEISENFQAAGFSAQSSGAVPLTKPAPETAKPSIKTEPMATYSFPDRKRGRLAGLLVSIIIILVLFSAIGVGLALYSHFWDPLWNPFRPSPETVIKNMLANMKNVKSYHALAQGEVSITANNTSTGKLSFSTDGESDITDVKNPKANFTFTVDLTVPGSALIPDSYSASANIVAVDNTLYFQLNDFAIPSTYSFPGLDISQIQGKWLKFDQDSMKALSQGQGMQIDFSADNNQELTKQIQDLVSTENILSVDKELNDEVISEQGTYHYSVKVTKEKLKDLANKIIDLQMQQTSSQSQDNDNTAITLLAKNMAEAFVGSFVDAIGDLNIEMWIGKKDYLLYKSQIDKSIDINKIFPGSNVQLAVKFNISDSNFNKPISVQKPESSLKIEDVLLPLIKTQKIESDMNQIGFIAQSVFYANKSYYSLCKNGLLNGYLNVYGQELINLNNDIIKQGAKKPVCFSSIKNYCVSTQLQDGSWLCISQNGILGKIKCISAQTICQ